MGSFMKTKFGGDLRNETLKLSARGISSIFYNGVAQTGQRTCGGLDGV